MAMLLRLRHLVKQGKIFKHHLATVPWHFVSPDNDFEESFILPAYPIYLL